MLFLLYRILTNNSNDAGGNDRVSTSVIVIPHLSYKTKSLNTFIENYSRSEEIPATLAETGLDNDC